MGDSFTFLEGMFIDGLVWSGVMDASLVRGLDTTLYLWLLDSLGERCLWTNEKVFPVSVVEVG